MAITNPDGSIILTTKIDQTGLQQGARSMKNTVAELGKVFATVFSVKLLTDFGKEAINLASDLQEVQNVVDVAFGNLAYKMEAFAKTSLQTFGLSELAAKRTASTYMAMAKGIGIAEETAADMSLTLAGLTGDLASFYNLTQERADTMVKSIFTGETEALKSVGIAMTEANLELFAMQNGISKSLSAMTQQEKALLRYNFVLQQTALAQGDFARTSSSWANQVRVLRGRWDEMKVTFGETFIAVGTLILPAINATIQGLTLIADLFKELVNGVYAFFTGQKLIGDAAESAKQTIEETTESQNALTKAVEETNSALEKTLASFDDIEILGSKTSEQKADILGGTGAFGVSPFEELADSAETNNKELIIKIKDFFEENAELIKEIGAVMAVIGLVLLMIPGKFFKGLAFLAIGATAILGAEQTTFADLKSEMQDFFQENARLIKGIGAVMAIVGLALLMIPNMFLRGLAFLAVGATAFIGAEQTSFADLKTEMTDFFIENAEILKTVGALLAIVGLCLIMIPNMFLRGVGLIAAGVATFDSAAKATDGGASLIQEMRSFATENVDLLVEIGSAMFLIGAILLTVDVFTGLKFLASGASLMVIPSVAEGGSVQEILNSFIEENWKIVMELGALLVLIGVTLLATTKGKIITSLSMIAAGAGLITWTIASEGETISSYIRSWIAENREILFGSSIALGLVGVLLVSKGFVTAGLGFLALAGTMLAESASGVKPGAENRPVFGQHYKHYEDVYGAYVNPDSELGKSMQSFVESYGGIENVPAPELLPWGVPAGLSSVGEAFPPKAIETKSASQTTVVLELNARELGRAVVETGGEETRRIGTKLVVS